MAFAFVPAALVTSAGVGPVSSVSIGSTGIVGIMALSSSLLLPHAASPSASTAAQQTVVRFL